MKRGLYTASTGMTTQMQRMDVVTNNLANVNTTGFKRDDATIRSFDDIMLERLNEPKDDYGSPYFNDQVGTLGFGVTIDKVTTDFTTGSHVMTDSPLDFAIDGDAFFTISVPQKDGTEKEFYTRNGSFKLTNDGYLVTSQGYKVIGQNGPINLGQYQSMPSVAKNGEIVMGDELVDKLKIVSFENNNELRKTTDDFYDVTERAVQKNTDFTVRQGYLESSNVNSVREMVEMISLQRNYEANQKTIQTEDSIMSKVANDIGRK